MGGNALKNIYTRRYNKDEYFQLMEEVIGNLNNILPNRKVDVIPAYSGKESFGDMDVLIESDNLPSNWINLVLDKFKPNEWVKNGDVLSFDYKEFQIDLILSNFEEYDFALKYFSYNDLGNLLGRIAHKLGLKFGHAGLDYVLRDNSYVICKINITRDFDKTLEFLGYNPQRYYEGFNNLEDIFNYVISSRYFNPDIYSYENRNHAARTRDKKRKTYREFLEWVEKQTDLPEFNYSEDKSVYIPLIVSFFDDFKMKYSNCMKEYRKDLLFKEKFNGNIVKSLTGLEGKELGRFIALLSNGFDSKDDFKEWIIKADQYMINYLINMNFNEFYLRG